MLDAGSSHTNLYIYKWPAEKENDTGVVTQIEECKVKGKMKKKGPGDSGHESMRGMWEVKQTHEKKGSQVRTQRSCYCCYFINNCYFIIIMKTVLKSVLNDEALER